MSESIIISPQLHLRPLEESDATAIHALKESNRDHLSQWMPWMDDEQTLQATLDFIKDGIAQNQKTRGPSYAIVYEKHIAGCIALPTLDVKQHCASIGYWLSKELQGKGVVTCACQSLLQHSFEVWGLNRLEIRAAEDNFKSRAIAERLGFTFEGILREREHYNGVYRNHVLYSLLKREYRATE